MEITGERYMPILNEPEISYEHWHRYLFASQYVADKSVLDIACGEGYGSNLLAERASRVLGADGDLEAIKFAAGKYFKPNLEFRHGLAEKMPIEDDHSFDVLVSFETLEHLAEAAQLSFMAEAKRVLKPDGALLVSTPNKFLYSDKPGYKNEFHRREFYIQEFVDLLKDSFCHVQLLGQQVYPGSYIWSLHNSRNGLTEYQLEHVNGGFRPCNSDHKEALYILAICSDEEIEPPSTSILIDSARQAIEQPKQAIQSLAAHVATVVTPDKPGDEVLAQSVHVLSAQAAEKLNELRQMLTQTEEQVKQLTAHQETLTAEIDALQTALGQLQAIEQEQQQALTQKEKQLEQVTRRQEILQTTLGQKEERIGQLQAAAQEQQQALAQKERQVEQLTTHREALQTALGRKEEEIGHLKAMKQVLYEIFASRGWKVLVGYWNLVDMVIPVGTRRRGFIEWVSSLPSSLMRRNSDKGLNGKGQPDSEITEQPVIENHSSDDRETFDKPTNPTFIINDEAPLAEEDIPTEDVTISVAIPMKNGGDDLRHLLRLLRNQKGFKAIEIVIVDSGSADGSLEVAEEYGAKIIQILPEEFSHSHARNLAAEHASGDYLLFTVQDALPPSDVWLHELFQVIKDENVVAVSCAEFPREDADLFYSVMSWNHYKFLEVNGQDRILRQPDEENHLTLRKNANISDIACLISRDVFMRYKFRNNYAEDLDLGLRLIRDGYQLALLGSKRVIHSHNRPTYYHLKRGYVDHLFISQILPDWPGLSIEAEGLFQDLLYTFEAISSITNEELPQITLPCTVWNLSTAVKEKFRTASVGVYHAVNTEKYGHGHLDNRFISFLKGISEHNYLNGKNDRLYDGILLGAMRDFTQLIFEYMDDTYEFVDDFVLEEFKSCLYKAYAFMCGTHLASCFMQDSESNSQKLREINDELTKEV